MGSFIFKYVVHHPKKELQCRLQAGCRRGTDLQGLRPSSENQPMGVADPKAWKALHLRENYEVQGSGLRAPGLGVLSIVWYTCSHSCGLPRLSTSYIFLPYSKNAVFAQGASGADAFKSHALSSPNTILWECPQEPYTLNPVH